MLLSSTLLLLAPSALALDFACTEAGFRAAVTIGGGPHLIDCQQSTTVALLAEIAIDNDVIIDGQGLLTLDGVAALRPIRIVPGVTVELRNLTITRGVAAAGGGIRNEGTLTLVGVTVQGNRAGRGGGISNAGALLLQSSQILDNFTTADLGGGDGGGIGGGNADIFDSTIAGNTAVDVGGGLALCNGSIVRSTISGNVSSRGGGLWSDSGRCTIQNSTFSNNISATTGGAIQLDDGSIDLIQTTIYDNTALAGISGANLVCCDIAMIANSILADGCSNSMAVLTNGGGNIESPTADCGFDDPTDQTQVPASELRLGPLADNGGGTRTHLPLTDSPAIDGGVLGECLATDQTGVARPQGLGCDVGAVEVLPEPAASAGLLAGLATLIALQTRGRRSRGWT